MGRIGVPHALQADSRAGGRLSGVLRPVPRAAARLHARRRGRDRDLFPRDDLSRPPGGEARSGAGAEI